MQHFEKIFNHLEAIKVDDVKLYDFKGASPFYDYFIVATSNERKSKAIFERLRKEEGINIRQVEGLQSEWVLIDLGDIVIHLFTKEAREDYDFDTMFHTFLKELKNGK